MIELASTGDYADVEEEMRGRYDNCPHNNAGKPAQELEKSP
jgi:hypothetical protein